MNFPDDALSAIAAIIQGQPLPGTATAVSGKFSIAWISGFFEAFGGDGLFPSADSPDAPQYILQFLGEINDTQAIDQLVCALPDFCASHEYRDDHPSTIAYEINKVLKPHGCRLKKRTAVISGFSSPSFVLETLNDPILDPQSTITLAPENVRMNVGKARQRFELCDYSGAISSSYTCVEALLKSILRQVGVNFSLTEGDIRQLYNSLAAPLKLNPAGESLETYQRAILQGVKSQLMGLYELANKSGDRHDAAFIPDRRHAKLAVNAAFSLCEFLLDSHEYEQQRQERKAAS
jgi:hypothetical protein